MATLTSATLRAEIDADPTGLGYAPLVVAGNDQGIADLLNAVKAVNQIVRTGVDVAEVVKALVGAEILLLTQAQRDLLGFMLLPRTIDPSAANIVASFGSALSTATATKANLNAIKTRDGSRAESLWGTGTVIGHMDVARAFGRG